MEDVRLEEARPEEVRRTEGMRRKVVIHRRRTARGGPNNTMFPQSPRQGRALLDGHFAIQCFLSRPGRAGLCWTATERWAERAATHNASIVRRNVCACKKMRRN